MAKRIRICLVDDHPIFREGVAQALRASSDFNVVAEGETADALGMLGDAVADILLLEIGMSGNGIEVARAIRQAHPSVKVVVLSASDDHEHVIQALRVGAQGYILKDVGRSDLVDAIKSIHRGQYYVTPALASRLLSRLVTHARGGTFSANSERRGRADLTCREREVLSYLSEGLSNREIAVKLGISIKTIKQHTMLLFSKMGVRNRIEAIVAVRKSDHSQTSGALRA